MNQSAPMKLDGQKSPPVISRRGASKLILWVFLWILLFSASIVVYNKTYDFTQKVLMHNLQIRPAAWILQLTLPDENIQYSEARITSARVRLHVLRGCDGVEAWLLIVTALLVYPMPWRRRLRSLLYGTVLIFSLNLLRIISLFHVALRRPEWMDIAHGLIWQSVMVLAAFIFVLIWMEPGDGQTREKSA